MRIMRLEDATLYHLIRTVGEDGDTIESYEEVKKYKIELQYLDDNLVVKDNVVRVNYIANVDKTYRVASIRNELEKYLLPKNNNKKDNISDYLLEYNDNKYRIEKVTPKYIEIVWR